MDDPIKDNLREYAELKIQEKKIKERIEFLNPTIKDYISDQNLDKIPTNLGVFSLKSVQVWEFSETVLNALVAVDKLKDREKADGTAKSRPRIDLMFTAAKK